MQGVTEPDPHTEVAVVVSFLERFLADRAQNATRTLAEYQGKFPGYEAVIAREYEAAIQGLEDAAEAGGDSADAPRSEPLRRPPRRRCSTGCRSTKRTPWASSTTPTS